DHEHSAPGSRGVWGYSIEFHPASGRSEREEETAGRSILRPISDLFDDAEFEKSSPICQWHFRTVLESKRCASSGRRRLLPLVAFVMPFAPSVGLSSHWKVFSPYHTLFWLADHKR